MDENQFDSSLGGREHLPQEANSLRFATGRSIEIAAMTENILRPNKTKLIFQTLPVHMRRRVMSHNCKRLPRKLREAHLEQLKKSGLPPKQKRPSRKYRRRPGNLLSEYIRRQRRIFWLETHIWHAKRFHMIERWGYKIAYAPCDKAFRACYRATSAHCLIQDISYLIPIQITGPIGTIKKSFTTMTKQECGLSICAKANITGCREGSVHLYKPEQYPYGYIGKVDYLWEVCNEIFGTLWLFVHPAFSEEVKAILTKLFILTNLHYCSDDKYIVPTKKKKPIENLNQEENVNIIFLPNVLNRFRLTGPKSHAIMASSLICVQQNQDLKNNEWVSLLKDNDTNIELEEKSSYWQMLKEVRSSAELPPRLVLGLIVKDPRLSRPARRTKAIKETTCNNKLNSLLNIPNFAASSPLWNLNIHENMKSKMLSNTQFIERITKTQIVPGEIFENDPVIQSVPIILVQRPGSQDAKLKKIGYGCGWDIIMPSGYGLPFWQTLIMFGARAGGLREFESIALEMGECYMPPDCNSGIQNEIRIEKELKEKYFRLPPNKRVNYIKLAINSPFRCLWKILLKDWCNEQIQEFYVLRDKHTLQKLQESVDKKRPLSEWTQGNSCLIPVYLQIVKKGHMNCHAIICLPKLGDFEETAITEPLHNDPNARLRKEMRQSHRTHIKSVKRKNVKLKKRANKGIRVVPCIKKTSKIVPSEYVMKMRNLWLPPNVENVRNLCSREVLGYVSQGAFSFSEARSCGVGYIAYNALRTLLENGLNRVLIRNTSSRTYRMAILHIIVS
ncbi:hypothetical protein EVAR_40659_1 [Eumeta japonica]|uniref:Uncharacterized protein n=1 Tax=Eumeta variegata TaxID=151549 RepID=A0A4C1X799_EUMVA|nr:hypothetical protein EVAR_40659_1 [Eumeta japonica]